ncbi:MAG: bifunctional phosphopantothenoylcysteine decarboxylase/phosphopantothenate--cysteine ligase CoaBC [Actinomycetota bacterium]
MVLENIRGRKVALGVCGGIAAYKVVEVARRLTQAGAEVRVIMTPSATNFVGALTFATLTGNPVRSELFPETVASKIIHTDLGRTSDLILIAPATAKVIAKYAHGISDELISATLLSAACPILMAPAMHPEMWDDEATRLNVATLQSRGVRFVGPAEGALAGPDSGVGRLAEASEILEAAAEELAKRIHMAGVNIVITAGGTREPIDAVRFIGNRSSGKMGYELAREAVRRGAKVTLITAARLLPIPTGVNAIEVETAAQMQQAVEKALQDAEVLIMAAAVSDWQPSTTSGTNQKLSKSSGPPGIHLEPAPDILAEAGSKRAAGLLPNLKVLAGFCAEVSDLEERAIAKLKAKGLDLIVANKVGTQGSGFEADTNKALLMNTEGKIEDLPLTSKRNLARLVLDAVAQVGR